jgi:hypothetical protein
MSSEPEAGIDGRRAIECLEKNRPSPASFDAQSGGIEFREPREIAYRRQPRSGIGTIVVVQDIEHCAVEISHLRADVVAGPPVDLVEQFLRGEFGVGLRRAHSSKQGGLAIVEGETMSAEHGACRIVPPEYRGGQLQVEVVAETRA